MAIGGFFVDSLPPGGILPAKALRPPKHPKREGILVSRCPQPPSAALSARTSRVLDIFIAGIFPRSGIKHPFQPFRPGCTEGVMQAVALSFPRHLLGHDQAFQIIEQAAQGLVAVEVFPLQLLLAPHRRRQRSDGLE